MLKLSGTKTARFPVRDGQHLRLTFPTMTGKKRELKEVRAIVVSSAQLHAHVDYLDATKDDWPIFEGYETEFLIPAGATLSLLSVDEGDVWVRTVGGIGVEETSQ